MGKHRHKKSFYDVDEDELESSHKHHHHHHHRRRRRYSSDKHDETKQRVPSIASINNNKIDDDEAALQSSPPKRQRSSSNTSQSPSRILSQLIEDPVFLANAGSKAKEFAETARQLLAKPDLDATTQQIICAMAQAAVNVGKRLSSSSLSSTPTDQCVDDLSITNSTTYSSSTLLSPTLSSTSSSSTSTTPQQQSHSISSHEEIQTPIESEKDEDILIKQMIERAMKLTQQGDTRHAQHLLGIIHEKLSNKRKRASTTVTDTNSNDSEKFSNSSSNDFYSLPTVLTEYSQSSNNTASTVSPSETEQSNDLQSPIYFTYPPLPPFPPPLPPPPLPDSNSTLPPPIPVPPIEQVQELLSNPSEVQDILKKLFGTHEPPKVSPPEEYQLQSHLPASYHSSIYSLSSRSNNPNSQSLRAAPPPPSISDPPPYNSSIALLQGNRRNLPPLQTPDRCFSSSNNKNNKQQTHRSSSFSSSSSSTSTPTNGIKPLSNSIPLSAPPLMKVNPTFPCSSSTAHSLEPISSRWSLPHDQQRHYHPFWCATCALGFPHQIAYQEHLRSHVPCNVSGCSYTASEALVRIHHQNIHENNLRNRSLHQTRPIFHPQQSLEQSWPLMRIYDQKHI